MPEEKKEFVKPIEIAKEHRVDPIVMGNMKVYVDKLGYKWEQNGSKGVAERVRIQIAKLDEHGDVIGRKKQINLPCDMKKQEVEAIFNAVIHVKDKPLAS